MNNLEKSEFAVAKIVSAHLNSGLFGETISIDILGEEFSAEHDFFEVVIRWLNDEGIIRYQDIIPDTADRAKIYYCQTVLTAYGFALLNQSSPVSQNKESLGETAKKMTE